MLKLLTFALIVLSLNCIAYENSSKVVYGEDNRLDVYEVTNPLYLKLAKSTAGMVSNHAIKKSSNGTFYFPRKVSLERGMNICPNERFANQPLLANCSGFLIGEDILVSAGHCFKGQAEGSCDDYSWIFGLGMQSENKINLNHIPQKNVYRCKRIINATLDRQQDFAVIQLDRKVEGREPLKYRTKGRVATNTELVVIGHPSMLPLKIADAGTILRNKGPYKFSTSLDTFQGNSGSAVFNAETGTLEGILVSGKTDYLLSKEGDEKSCKIVNTCDQDGVLCEGKDRASLLMPGEQVTRITTVSNFFPKK